MRTHALAPSLAAPLRAHSAPHPAPDGDGTEPVQRVPTSGRFNWGIWGRGGGSIRSDENLDAIYGALDRYHRGRDQYASDQAFADARAGALDDAQTGVNRYLGAMGDLQQGGLPRDYMLDLMDQLQEAQVEHTNFVHENDLRLFSAEELGEGDRERLDTLWDQVRNGAGGRFVLPGGEENEADNQRTRAGMARLLSRRHGRELMTDLLADGAPFPLSVRYRDRLPAEEREGREANVEALRRLEAQLAAPDADRATLLDQRMAFYDETREDYRNTSVEEPARAARRQGGGATMTILRGLRDSENLNHRGVGTNLIAAPAHVVMGHELIHALHYRTGDGPLGNPDDYALGTDLAHWQNPEEHRTIAAGPGVTENDLRQEHGLPAREGHTGPHRRTLGSAAQQLLYRGAGTAAAVGALAVARYLYNRWGSTGGMG